ncbi:hypothetical protein BH11BAC3_BH11BAC3_17690 [soil metagenome]
MYLQKVYNQWKLLFWVIVSAIFFQAFFMAKGIENIPFFLYHMFGSVQSSTDSVNIVLIKTPEGYFNTNKLSGREREMLMNNTNYFIEQKKQGFGDPLEQTVENRFKNRVNNTTYNYLQQSLLNDSTHLAAYPGWWQRYFERVQNKKFASVEIVSSYIYFNSSMYKSQTDSIVFTVFNK